MIAIGGTKYGGLAIGGTKYGGGAIAGTKFGFGTRGPLASGTVSPRGAQRAFVEWDNPSDSRDQISPNPFQFSWNGRMYRVVYIGMRKVSTSSLERATAYGGYDFIVTVEAGAAIADSDLNGLHFGVEMDQFGGLTDSSLRWLDLPFGPANTSLQPARSDWDDSPVYTNVPAANQRRFLWRLPSTTISNRQSNRWQGGATYPIRITEES